MGSMKTGAVAFLDILGFKGIWQTRGEQELLKIIGSIPQAAEEGYAMPAPEKGWPGSGRPKITVLSDTVVITMDAEQPHGLLLISNVVYRVMHLFLQSGLFVRGAIGWGKYAHSENTFLGPAIDDVATWYEVADWIGVIAVPAAGFMVDRFSPLRMGVGKYGVLPFFRHEVPLKGGRSLRLQALNWPGYLEASLLGAYPGQTGLARQSMEQMFSRQSEVSFEIARKYENTLKFVDIGSSQVMPDSPAL
jgi:hypothetical protein